MNISGSKPVDCRTSYHLNFYIFISIGMYDIGLKFIHGKRKPSFFQINLNHTLMWSIWYVFYFKDKINKFKVVQEKPPKKHNVKVPFTKAKTTYMKNFLRSTREDWTNVEMRSYNKSTVFKKLQYNTKSLLEK